MVARAHATRPSGRAADRVLEQLRRQHDHGAVVTAVAGMADSILLVRSENECRRRVDHHRLAAGLPDGHAPAREGELRDIPGPALTLTRSTRTAHPTAYLKQRRLDPRR